MKSTCSALPLSNALLKTLEEPPGHVMFVFATTELHKIPITILSRCQQHDFRRIGAEAIADHLRQLVTKEGSDIDRESVTLIAREADGSMRDALSLLDQVMACVEGAITYEQVIDILGVVDRQIIFDMAAAIIDGSVSELLEIVDRVYTHGHDLKKLYAELTEHFRNLLVIKLSKDAHKLVDLPAHEIERMQGQVGDIPAAQFRHIFDLLYQDETVVRFSSQPRLALEMVLMRLVQTPPTLSIDDLIEKTRSVEKGNSSRPPAGRPTERQA